MVDVAQGTWLRGLGDFLLERATLTSRACLSNA